MKNLIKNNKGVSLIEVVAALPLAALVLFMMTMAIVNFIKTYEETRLYTQMQNELFAAVETIRYGYTKAGVTDNYGLIGVYTANKVEIGPGMNNIKIIPLNPTGLNFEAKFRLDGDGSLRAYGNYGVLQYHFADNVVFPSSTKEVDNKPQFQITRLVFSDRGTFDGNIYVLGVEIEAEVRFREKEARQSVEDDERFNVKKIQYETAIYLGNAKSGNPGQ